jgi:hypothetical protein
VLLLKQITTNMSVALLPWTAGCARGRARAAAFDHRRAPGLSTVLDVMRGVARVGAWMAVAPGAFSRVEHDGPAGDLRRQIGPI